MSPNYFIYLTDKYGAPPGKCNACGRCCRAISLDDSLTSLSKKLQHDLQKLTKIPDHPHKAQIRLFEHDVLFILKNWREISRAEAEAANPALAGDGTEGRHFFRCRMLTEEGKCSAHHDRPQVCRGYPWYGGLPREGALFAFPCGYEVDLQWLQNILDKEQQG